MPRQIVSNILGLLGATLGGAAGWYAAGYLSRHGLYAMILPGGLLGTGCAALARHRSTARGVICGLAAILLSLYTERDLFPFPGDDSFSYLVSHLPPWKWPFHGAGALLAFWCGRDHFGGPISPPGAGAR